MIWTLEDISGLPDHFIDAGQPDQGVIDRYARKLRRPLPPMAHPQVPRFYYLMRDESRIRLTCVGTPLDKWSGGAMIKVGTREVIGEFAGNRHLIGKQCLHLQLNPLDWLSAPTDEHFKNGKQALEAISMQILDMQQAEKAQEHIARKYRWK